VKVQFIIPKYRCRLGHEHVAGDVCDLPDHVAVKLIGLGYAEAVRAQKPETAERKREAKNTAKRTGKTITKADLYGEEA
jgi:hypothetical protein